MERTTWMTEERIAAPATGAPGFGRVTAGATSRGLQIQKQAGLVPSAHGPGLVRGSTTVTFHTDDHVDMGRTWDGTPLGSLGAGNG